MKYIYFPYYINIYFKHKSFPFSHIIPRIFKHLHIYISTYSQKNDKQLTKK